MDRVARLFARERRRMTMNRLYLIRHGRPASTWGGADDDPGLDDEGKAQARAVAATLMALTPELRPVSVVSSPLRRCRETAQPLADLLGVAVEIDAAVGEIPTPAGLAGAERPAWLRRSFAGSWSDIEGDIDYEAWRRAVIAELEHRAGAAVFSHFVAINAAISSLTGSDQVIVFRPDHTSLTTLEVGPSGLEIVERGAQAATSVL
jgi:broad specificity phosphatase PhoE